MFASFITLMIKIITKVITKSVRIANTKLKIPKKLCKVENVNYEKI